MKKKKYIMPFMEQATCVMMKFAICSGNPPQDVPPTGNGDGNLAPRRKVFY